MKFYFAPMEGIAGYIYRNAYNEYFHGIDKYFAPFLSTSSGGVRRMKEFKDILPENNQGMYLVPQLLSNRAEDFVKAAREVQALGYRELNLNVGCPSGTVTSKKKGAGLLLDTEKLDNFLYEIFAQCASLGVNLSIKTRIGFYDVEEFEKILDIYNQYPLHELIIHPRTREDYYHGKIKPEAFGYAVRRSKNKLCYNGDIFRVAEYQKLVKAFAGTNMVTAVMFGRGILRNPSLIDNINEDRDCPDWKKIFAFHDRLYHDYKEYLSGDTNLLFKMKEVWLHMVNALDTGEVMPSHFISEGQGERFAKKIKKSKNIYEYDSVIRELKYYLGIH